MIRITGIGDRDRPEWMIGISGIRNDGRELTIAALYTTEEEAQKAIGVLQRYEVEQEQRGTIDPTEDGLAIPI